MLVIWNVFFSLVYLKAPETPIILILWKTFLERTCLRKKPTFICCPYDFLFCPSLKAGFSL